MDSANQNKEKKTVAPPDVDMMLTSGILIPPRAPGGSEPVCNSKLGLGRPFDRYWRLRTVASSWWTRRLGPHPGHAPSVQRASVC